MVVLDGRTANPGDLSWESFEKVADVTVYESTADHDIASRMADAQIVYTNRTPLCREIILNAPKLQFIGVLGTGYNNVDVAAAGERGIPVTNVPDYGTEAVAQFVFALLLEVCHRTAHHHHAVLEGRWEEAGGCFWDYPLLELYGKTMGIIGFGRIGQATGRIAQGFGMRVIACDSRGKREGMASLEEVLQQSDVLSLHCPLLPETRELINRQTIERMKDGAILINTSRGGLICEQDLREALLSDKVYAAAADVAAVEPMTRESPLFGLENCIITPHIAWAPREARARLLKTAAENLLAWMDGNPVHVVNRQYMQQ